jgi:hypothetical protein
VLAAQCAPVAESIGMRWTTVPTLTVSDPCRVKVTAKSVDAKVSLELRPEGPLCVGFPTSASGAQLPDAFMDDPCTPTFSVEPLAGAESFTLKVPCVCAKQTVNMTLRCNVGQGLRDGQDVPCAMSAVQ